MLRVCRYTFWMGELPIVTVNEYHKMVETFQKDGDSYANRLTSIEDFHELVRGMRVCSRADPA